MPVTILGARGVADETFKRRQEAISRVHYDYDYPEGLDIRPFSPLHDLIIQRVLDRAQESKSVISQRYDSWNKMTDTLTAYIPQDVAEKELKEQDERRPTSIVVPVTFATLETLMTYLVAAFLQPPIFRYEGLGPEDVNGGILLELLIAAQSMRFRHGLPLHTSWRDSLAYGFGVVTPVWTQMMGYRARRKEESFFDSVLSRTGFRKRNEVEGVEEVLFEGNELENIDPFCYLPDPNVAVQDVQKGEFVGWVRRDNLMSLLGRERDSEGAVFNVRYLKHVDGRSTLYEDERGGKATLPSNYTNPVDVVYMYVNLIPSEWKLGDSDYPERWAFGVAADSVVIQASPLGLYHNQFPVCVAAPDSDGYSTGPLGRLEVMYGLQTAIDWLFNAHVANVRKSLNDMIVYDPSIINTNDIMTPGPGKLIRSRQSAWGKSVKDAIFQLDVRDVTAQNIPDIGFMANLVDSASGAVDAIKGVIERRGSRVSASEYQGTRSSALSRLEKTAMLIGLQQMQGLGYMLASQTQQMMSKEEYVKIVGEWPTLLESDTGRVRVTPFDLLVDYDVIVRDGSVPGSEFADVWVQVFQILGQSPLLMQQFDMVRIFKHIARLSGAKNVDDFQLKSQPQPIQGQVGEVEIRPDEEVIRQAEAGNLVQVGGR